MLWGLGLFHFKMLIVRWGNTRPHIRFSFPPHISPYFARCVLRYTFLLLFSIPGVPPIPIHGRSLCLSYDNILLYFSNSTTKLRILGTPCKDACPDLLIFFQPFFPFKPMCFKIQISSQRFRPVMRHRIPIRCSLRSFEDRLLISGRKEDGTRPNPLFIPTYSLLLAAWHRLPFNYMGIAGVTS